MTTPTPPITKNRSTTTPIRWGMIGCGSVTEVKSGPAYQQTKGFRLQAVTRRDYHKAKDYARRRGVPEVFADAKALIYSASVDAVYIATPPDSHEAYALEVARAGKPCCIEKPLAPSYQACVRIRDAFKSAALPLFVAYYRRSLPRFVRVKDWLEAGKLGELRHVSWSFSRPASELDRSGNPNWRTERTTAPSGYFDDLASHGLDLILFLLGDVAAAAGFSANQQGLYTAKDTVAGAWLHQRGVTGSGFWNLGSQLRQDRLELLGGEGNLRFSVFGEAPLRLETAEGVTEVFVANPKHIQQFHVENIQRALDAGLTHPSTGESATRTAWLMAQLLAVP